MKFSSKEGIIGVFLYCKGALSGKILHCLASVNLKWFHSYLDADKYFFFFKQCGKKDLRKYLTCP